MDFKDLEIAAQKLYLSTLESDFEYPNSKDKLFVESRDDWRLNACITKFGADETYIAGYLDAAKLLARVVIFSQSHMDTLVYPIIYLYRHYLELRFKRLIRQGAIIKDFQIDAKLEEVLADHNLMALWNSFIPFFEEVSGDNEDFEKVKKGIESYINQIHQIDPGSLAFRYEKQKHGKKHTLEKIERINIGVFCQNMEKLTSLLEGVSCEFGMAKDYTDDMRSEYGAY